MEAERRGLLTAWAHLGVLWSFAVAQPLLDLLGDTPEFFVARGNTRGDILLLAFGLVLLPPTAMLLVELCLLRARRLRQAVHLAFVALLVAVFVLQLEKDLLPGAGTLVAIGLAVAVGGAGAVLYARRAEARTALTVLSPAPALFLALFLLVSPVSDLVLPRGEVSAAGARGDGAPVVVLVLDELSGGSLLDSHGRVDPVRYPNFAELARGSTWYRNATSVDFSTERAVPALLTGTQPAADSLPIAADHPRNLFTLLGGGYRFHVQEPATELCPESLCGERVRKESGDRLRSLVDDLGVVALHLIAPGDLENELPAVDTTFEGFGDGAAASAPSGGAQSGIPASAFEDRTRQFERFLRGIGRDAGRPTLDFLHVALPHWPWQYLPSGSQYPSNTERVPGLAGSNWVRDPSLPAQGYQRYLLQLGYVDRLVGRLIERLRSEGLYDDALIVVTADHGVSFRAGQPRRIPTKRNFADIASVPLFIREPGQRRGRVDESPVRTIDLVPTIADALGLRTDWRFDGRSARRGIDGRRRLTVMTGEPVHMGFAEFTRMRDAEVRRRIDLFGSGDGGQGIFAVGAGSGLIGLRADDLVAAPPDGVRGELDDLALLEDVDPGSGLIPALVRGRIVGELPPGSRVAVALNGTIQGIAPTYSDEGELRFGAMLPTRAFRRGRNEVDLFSVTGDAAHPTLAAISQRGRTASGRLATGGERSRLVLGSGRSVPVAPGAATGFVEKRSAPSPGQLQVIGWAADPRKRRRVERVLVFADGRLVAAGRPAVPRPDVVASLGRAALYSGFRLVASIPDAEAVAATPSRLRVFGMLDGRATELARVDAG